jgi:hypothetical protein
MAGKDEQPKKKGQSLFSQAQVMSAKEGMPLVDALIKLDDKMRVVRDIQESKAQPERQAAAAAAKTRMENGVKVTEYPYVKGGGGGGGSGTREMQLGADLDPKAMMKKEEGYKKGGKVSSASSRGDGIAQRGKTRGKMIMCGGGMIKGKK